MKHMLCGLAALALSATVIAQPANQDAPSLDDMAALQDIPVNEIRIFAEVMERIRATYVEEIDDRKLLESAIRGMLLELDPHSAYLTPEDFDELQVTTSGEFGGLGIEISMEDGFVTIVTPLDDTPASRAGLQAGDIILKIDDTFTKGLNLGEAVELMRGEIGEDVTLSIMRGSESSPREVQLTRDRIAIRSVRSEIIEPGYGYLRITQFQNNTGRDVRQHLSKLKESGDLNGLILDLRNNPGGVLGGAIQVSDLFLDNGLITYTQGREAESRVNYGASRGDILDGVPLVVLVNGGSASASEIVAGALQDQQRAIIIGRRTFGKGSVQTVLPLHDERALKLTTAKYYTPGGRSIQAEGIVPDITVDIARVELQEDQPGMREADLPRHLRGTAPDDSDAEKKDSLAGRDYDLYQALSILKGIHLSRSR
ncbi:S41 family peptidase [Alcanivorax sp. JB21]|uniref:S41 family peptidase n=1 Tax=Alcanivorax limicola TaxID=2874102 RepID=UPI001CC144F3|nr:S41 family peptidase [Alcanivorax limicola]